MDEKKFPAVINLLNVGERLKSATDVYAYPDSINKYALALLFNKYVALKGDRINILKFNKRTNLSEEQIVTAEQYSDEMQRAITDDNKKFKIIFETQIEKQKEQEKLIVKAEAENTTFNIDGKEFREIEIMDDNAEITNSSIADFIIKYYSPFLFEGNLYYYMDGIYLLDDNRKVGSSKVNQIIEEITNYVYDKTRLENKRNSVFNEIQTLVMLRNRFDKDPFDKYDNMICVNNGIVKFDWDAKKYELIPHSPKFTFRTKYAFNLDPKASTTEVEEWLKRLSTDNDTKEINYSTYDKIVEMAASPIVMQLTRGTFKSSYLVVGAKHSGKTTLLEDFLKIRFYGENACSGTPLKDLCEERFGRDSIIGKSVNICDDLSDSTVKNAGKWKQLTGGGRVEVESKYQKKVSIFFPMAIFSANEFPKVSDVDEDTAFWDRWQLIKLTNIFGKDINYANNSIDKYVSPFALLVIKEIFDLKRTGSVQDTDVRQILIQNWKRDNDSVTSFAYDNIVYDPDGCASISEMYDIYTEFCEDNGFINKTKPIRNIRQLKSDLKRLIKSNHNYDLFEERVIWDQAKLAILKGIRLKTSPEGNYHIVKKYKTENQLIIDQQTDHSDVQINFKETTP
jgi:phage/plasmid-associated DNA primase